MRRRLATAVVVLAGALGAAGCLVEVEETRDPGAAFDEARAEAERLRGRKGPASRVNLLAYDPSDNELVRISLPLWLVRKLDRDGRLELDLDDEDRGRSRRLARRLRSLKDIERAGLGVLLEVEERSGERVLVWLS